VPVRVAAAELVLVVLRRFAFPRLVVVLPRLAAAFFVVERCLRLLGFSDLCLNDVRTGARHSFYGSSHARLGRLSSERTCLLLLSLAPLFPPFDAIPHSVTLSLGRVNRA
jgi:hypothetical protein